MKVITFLLSFAVLVFSSVYASAYSRMDPIVSMANAGPAMSATMGIASRVGSSVQQWVGKPVRQLIGALGEPSYTSVTSGGLKVYDFVREPQHVGPVDTYQFVIARSGKIISAALTL
jgi:hypothetical protein